MSEPVWRKHCARLLADCDATRDTVCKSEVSHSHSRSIMEHIHKWPTSCLPECRSFCVATILCGHYVQQFPTVHVRNHCPHAFEMRATCRKQSTLLLVVQSLNMLQNIAIPCPQLHLPLLWPVTNTFSLALHMFWCNACRVTVTLGGCLLAAMALTRSVLPRSLRFLATHSSAELFQLTVLAFCLVSAWISGYLVSFTPSMPCIFS